MNKNYWKFWTASTVTNLGDGVAAVAYPWLATLLTRDPFLISMVAAATRLPWLLLSLPAGVIIDRTQRKQLIVGADMFRFVLTLAVVGFVTTIDALNTDGEGTGTQLAILCLAAFLLGSAEVLRDNAAQTLLPSIVSAKDLPRANGWMWSAENVTNNFIGPPLAGLLIALALPLPFLLDAATFLLALILLASLAIAKRENIVSDPPLNAFKAGFLWLWQRPPLRDLAIVLGLMNATFIATHTVMILYAQELLLLNAAEYGILLTGAAVGSVLGGLAAGPIIDRLGQRLPLILAVALMVVDSLIVYWAGSAVLVWLAIFASGFAAVVWNVVTVSLRQRVIPDDLLGRVNSVYRFFGWGMLPIGALAGGALVSLVEPGFGREFALRLPFIIAAISYALMLMFVAVRISKSALEALEVKP